MFIEDHLGKSEQLMLMFRAVESARNGVVITDPNQSDNPIIYTNPAFTEITGYEASEILGQNCRFLQGKDRDQEPLVQLRRALSEERAVTVVLRNYRKNGKHFFNELTVSPVLNEQGRLISFVGIQNDITARVEAERRISEFYSIVSHELRTPIAKIKSSLSVIAEGEAGPITDSVRRFVDISARSADSLWKLIENILDFKKLEAGKFRLLPQRLSLADLIENVVSEFESVASQSSITINAQCQLRPYVQADGSRLAQVMENLLSNAVKFSPSGSAIQVRLVPSTVASFARVEVRDEGRGIAEADVPKLFERFQQIDSPDQRTRGGTGLGLSICKAIIEAHGGRIGAAPNQDRGSVFWFELRIYK